MSKTILVVDDEPDVVTYLSTVLKDAGYDTLEAACTCLDRVDSKNSPSSSGLWELWETRSVFQGTVGRA